MILISMMVLCTQVNKMYVIATLSLYPHRASLKNMPGHGGNRTYQLWNASPMLCQLSYAVRSIRVCDILKLTSSSFDINVVLNEISHSNRLSQLAEFQIRIPPWPDRHIFSFLSTHESYSNCSAIYTIFTTRKKR